jgi:hypothetical protein
LRFEKKGDKFTFDYLMAIVTELGVMAGDGQAIAPDEERCKCIHPKIPLARCMKAKKVSGKCEGKCSFTPRQGISPSTVWRLVRSRTAKNLKSLSGLDDTKVLKCRNNFARKYVRIPEKHKHC